MDKIKLRLAILCIIVASIGVASALLTGAPTTLPLPDGRNLRDLPNPELNMFDISGLLASTQNENLNTLYYKVVVPNDVGNEYNLSAEFAESKPYYVLKPNYQNGQVTDFIFASGKNNALVYAWVCCNVTKGDRLYTADATNNSALRGTLTNLYNINYKTRIQITGTWINVYVGASTNPSVYNRRGSLHLDGTLIGRSQETRNVSVAGVPELMKVLLD